MCSDRELKRLRWRATHRGTREADLLVGSFFEAFHRHWNADDRAWFADLLDEQDVDILAWAHETWPPPERLHGPMMLALQRLDYLPMER